MSVDLEDYYCKLPFSQWEKHESRLFKPTKKLLELFDKYNVKATFFTLGYITERHPELIKEIKSKGHEIASHGYSHQNLNNITKEEFEQDLVKSIQINEDVSGDKVRGFRAPFFSIKNNEWAFEILKKHLTYDSSVYPVNLSYGSLKGAKNAPTHIYKMLVNNPYKEDYNGDFIEIPLTTLNIPFGRIPVGGGAYLRILPTWMLKRAINKINENNFPAVFYVHPQDLEYDIPKVEGYKWYSYYGLKNAVKKFEIILKSFKFSTANQVINNFQNKSQNVTTSE